ncbi:hypothetical protein C0995_010159 [Termitomyces sp. Mi166|nr:hypothetical protein C0995_010159 [Termitomyces sp. Mi166\
MLPQDTMVDTVADGSLTAHEKAQSHLREDSSGLGGKKRRRTEDLLQGDNIIPRHLFDTLPFEIIAEILLYTNSPRDVVAVARCSKFFCQTLVHPASDYIWKNVRKAYSLPPPEPMSIFTEASYSVFLFGGGTCEACGKYTEALYSAFGTRLDRDYTLLNSSLPHDEKIKQCLTYAENDRWSMPTLIGRGTLYRQSDAVREANECMRDPNGYLEKKKKKIAFITKYMETSGKNHFKNCIVQLYTPMKPCGPSSLLPTSKVSDLPDSSKQLAKKKGWVHWDLMTSTPYGPMHRFKSNRIERVTQKDFDDIADDIKRALAHLAMLRERKAREAAYSSNRYAVEQHHQRLRSQQPHVVLPSLEVFRRLPIVQLLQGTSPETVEFPPKDPPDDVATTLRKEKWVVDRLNTELRQWREKARRDLAAILGYENWTTSNTNANSKVLHPVDRVTARFLCKTCSKVASRYREDDCLDFAGACAHFCPGKKNKRFDGIWAAEQFVKDEKAIAALQILLTLRGTDASFLEAATALESFGTTIVCASCGPGVVMNAQSLVGHSHRHEKMTIKVMSKEQVANLLLHPPQPLLVRSITGSEPRSKAVRLELNFGCRHCLSSVRRQVTVVESQPQQKLTPVEVESPRQPKSTLGPEASTSTKQAPMKAKHVAKRFSFPGINSHLKEKSCALWALSSSSLVYGGLVQNPNLILPPGHLRKSDVCVVWTGNTHGGMMIYFLSTILSRMDAMAGVRDGCLMDFRRLTVPKGATIVDAMSTMDYFKEAVAHVSNINFSQSKTDDTVRSVLIEAVIPETSLNAHFSVFETVIRYLGGMLSAYELSDYRYPVLLEKSQQLADKIVLAWTGDNDIPWGHIDFTSNKPKMSNIAEAGTLTMELGILSKYTGNLGYRKRAERAVRGVASQPAPLPGLPAQGIDPATGKSIGGYVTWGGGSDSYFEYLIKYPRLFNDADVFFADTWRLAVDSSIKTLLKISTTGKHAYLGDYDGETQRIKHVSSHLECFHGGNWILGGSLLDNQTIVDIGLELVDACWNTYASTATGIGPEGFAYVSEDGGYIGDETLTAEQLEFNAQHGFYPTASYYILRPEVLESNFYAWRTTGDPKFIARAASALDSFTRYLSFDQTYSGIWNVNNKNSKRINDMESFWFAEVLKYLTFDDPKHISLDEYIFNTEAHPFKLPAPKDHYGSFGFPTATSSKSFRVQEGNTPEISQIAGMPSIKNIFQGIQVDDVDKRF